MPTFAHYTQSGQFAYTFEASAVPPIPLADDGRPRTIQLSEKPEKAGKKYTPDRDGAWVESDADPLPVPAVLPAWRILSVMDLHGYTPTVEAIIDGLPKNAKIVAKRQLDGSNIERTHALVLAAQQVLGLTDAQVDALFWEADALV